MEKFKRWFKRVFITGTNYKIKIKLHDKESLPIKFNKGNWIDLIVSDSYEFKTGDFIMVDFGISLELPKYHEAIIASRSSTFKNYGIILTNGIGIIDDSYNGDNDVWKGIYYCTRDGKIEKGSRIAQFRIQKNQPELFFDIVDTLDNNNRGGYGTSGV